MSQQLINNGISDNDRSGDTIRTAFGKVNANFTELYAAVGADAAGNQLVNGDQVVDLDANGTLTLPSGTIEAESAINLKITSNNYLILNSGQLSQIEIGRYQAGGVVVLGGTNTLTEVDGALNVNGNIRQSNSFTRTTSAPAPAATATVVWSANADWMSSIKLTIQVEGNVTGDNTGWHVQTCEATIASRGYANGVNGYGDPEMSVYGIIYTSTNPLATFEVQRNVNTRLVEVVATGTDLNNNIMVSVHSVEIGTTD